MNTKRALALFVLVLSSWLPFSCEDDCSGGGGTFEISVEELAPKFGSYNRGSFFEMSEMVIPLSHNVFALVLEVTKSIRTQVAQQMPIKGFSFIPRAVACDPLPAEFISEISEFKFVAQDTLFANGQSFPPNSDLSHLFYIPERGCDNLSDCNLSIQIFEDPNPWRIGLGDVGSQTIFQLIDAPDALINTSFHVQMTFNKVDTFELDIGPVLIE
ncbi:MAG: hypothetical protein AAGC88_02125 [Bacteroidota bacterium]